MHSKLGNNSNHAVNVDFHSQLNGVSIGRQPINKPTQFHHFGLTSTAKSAYSIVPKLYSFPHGPHPIKAG